VTDLHRCIRVPYVKGNIDVGASGILNLDSFGVLSASMCSPKKNDSFPAGRIRGLIQALCRCLETALYDAQLI